MGRVFRQADLLLVRFSRLFCAQHRPTALWPFHFILGDLISLKLCDRDSKSSLLCIATRDSFFDFLAQSPSYHHIQVGFSSLPTSCPRRSLARFSTSESGIRYRQDEKKKMRQRAKGLTPASPISCTEGVSPQVPLRECDGYTSYLRADSGVDS